jgi:hypothetical protein
VLEDQDSRELGRRGPFAWVDDEVTDADRQWVSEHHPGPALIRTVDASVGLTDQDFAALDVWFRELV